jgi:hypothetical protein
MKNNEINPILTLIKNEKNKSRILSPNILSIKKSDFLNNKSQKKKLSKRNSEIILNHKNKNIPKIQLMNNNYKIDNFDIDEFSKEIHVMHNYNINNYISRTDERQLKKKIILRLNKIKNYKEPLSICLINKNSQNIIKTNKFPKIRVISSDSQILQKFQPKIIKNISNKKKFSSRNSFSSYRTNNICFHKNNNFKFEKGLNKKLSRNINEFITNSNSLNEKNIETKNEIHNIIYSILQPRKEEPNKKKMFKNLKTDIRKNELKVKDILDSLIRTQKNNDEDLKRKGFIIKSIENKYNKDDFESST